MKLSILWFAFFLPFQVLALEIDEKLTTRLLKISRSKRTVLINRGLEDGLVVGDHAKFFLTTGVIARGVVIKAAPTRSIWSLYRLVDQSNLHPDKVVNIKISSPVKLTKDSTKGLQDGAVPPGVEVIAQAQKGDNLSLNDEEKRDIESLGTLPNDIKIEDGSGIDNKTFEFYGLLHWGGLTSHTDLGNEGSFNGKSTNMDFSLGVEKYFSLPHHLLSQFSLQILARIGTWELQSLRGQKVSHSVLEYGLGGAWHFMSPPLSYRRVIGFTEFTLGLGQGTDRVGNARLGENVKLKGSSHFFSLGTGFKYYTRWGFGGRVLITYYRRQESYVFAATSQNYTKRFMGPRLQLGLSYRW